METPNADYRWFVDFGAVLEVCRGVVAWPGVGCVMTRRRPSPAAPGPLEGYAARFHDLFTRVAQRRGFRGDPPTPLAAPERHKTPNPPAGAEPVTAAQHP